MMNYQMHYVRCLFVGDPGWYFKQSIFLEMNIVFHEKPADQKSMTLGSMNDIKPKSNEKRASKNASLQPI